jgi:hypothetical protein
MEIKTATRRVANPAINRRGGTREVDLAVTEFDRMDMHSAYEKESGLYGGDDESRSTYRPVKGKNSRNDAPTEYPWAFGAGEVTITTIKSEECDAYCNPRNDQLTPTMGDGQGQNDDGYHNALSLKRGR